MTSSLVSKTLITGAGGSCSAERDHGVTKNESCQVGVLMALYSFTLSSLLKIFYNENILSVGTDWDVVRKCVCAAYFHQVGFFLGNGNEYWIPFDINPDRRHVWKELGSMWMQGTGCPPIFTPPAPSLGWVSLLTMWSTTSSSWLQRWDLLVFKFYSI